jgi:Domain of unknown function (DUF6134)
MRMLLAGLVLGLGLAAVPAVACPDVPPDAAYTIQHASHGVIGRHVIAFTCAGDELIVETAIEAEVRVLRIPVFQRAAHYREVWRDDMLIAFESHFADNGEVYEVSTRADGGQTVIDGRAGHLLAPPTVVSNHPWNHAVIDRTLLFDTRGGALQRVLVADAGEEAIAVGGRQVRARHYVITGDLERELWYGLDGTWLQSRLDYRGDAITLTRE